MKHSISVLLIFSLFMAFGQKKKKEDISAILSMCGCYDISFNFAETFATDTAYEFHKNYTAGATELVLPIQQDKNKIVLQHLLVVMDTMVIKHWRQDWIYENTDLYQYEKDHTWAYVKKSADEVKGQWTQKVYQVDDSPRYEGSASWVHVDGKHYWENTADAPLPRRERTKRSDYNVMTRTNRQELTDSGWIHEQDNAKVLRQDGETDQTLAWEKGLNTYTKIDDSKCQAAQDWWAANQNYWADVRIVWDEVFAKNKDLELSMKAEKKQMYRRLFALGKKYSGEAYDATQAKKEIREAIQLHIKSDIELAAK
jgi:hypothetical protein